MVAGTVMRKWVCPCDSPDYMEMYRLSRQDEQIEGVDDVTLVS